MNIEANSDLQIYNYYQYRIPNINLELLDKYLYSIYKLSNNNSEIFIDYILLNLDKLKSWDTNDIYTFILEKHNIIIDKSYEIKSININNINNIIRILLNIKSNCFIFSVTETKIVTEPGLETKIVTEIGIGIGIEVEIGIGIEVESVTELGIDTEKNIYIINYNYYIHQKLNNNKIIEIKYNNYTVIKYDEVDEPFKNIIPTNCFNLIYKKDRQYNITYFINNNVITIKISKQNNFLPIGDDIENFQMIINNYGYNSMNLIYVNETSPHGYIITEDEYEYLTKKLSLFNYDAKNSFDNNDFNFITEKYCLSITKILWFKKE